MKEEIIKAQKKIEVLEIVLKVLYVLFFPSLLLFNWLGLVVMVSVIFGLYQRLKYCKAELSILEQED